MARGAAEVQESGVKSQFVQRVANLPMVHSAWDYAANTYTSLKGSSRLVDYTLTTAEKSLSFVAEHAKPVVSRFEKQILVVDALACKGLGTLEEKAPFITKAPGQILGDLYASTVTSGLEKYEGLKNYGTEKVLTVADYSLQKASAILPDSYSKMVANSVDSALSLTERYIDCYLPPIGEEGCVPEAGKKGIQPVVIRVGRLSNKLRERLYKQATTRLQHLQQSGRESVAKIYFTLDVVRYAKDSLEATNQKLAKTIQRLWAELTAEEEQTKEKEKGTRQGLQEQILSVARNVTRELIQAYQNARSKNGDNGTLDDTSGVLHIARNVVIELSRLPVIVVRELPHVAVHSASRLAGSISTSVRRYVEVARVLPAIFVSAGAEIVSDTVVKVRARVVAVAEVAVSIPREVVHELLPLKGKRKKDKPTENDVAPVQNAVDGSTAVDGAVVSADQMDDEMASETKKRREGQQKTDH